MEEANLITTKLLTLLNVSAVKSGKKRRVYDELVSAELGKLNKRKSTKFAADSTDGSAHVSEKGKQAKEAMETEEANAEKEKEPMDVDEEKEEDCELQYV
jgi:U3 small nucleolar RNA-associated protein 25